MRIRSVLPLLALLGVLGIQGCTAALGLTLFGAGAGVAAGTGISYTLDSIAYKTFTIPIARLQTATLATLRRMGFEVKKIHVQERPKAEASREIEAAAGDRDIEIELERLSSRATRMRVNVKRGVFLRDKATAAEIIVQTERTLSGRSKAARSRRRVPAARALADR